MYWQGGGTVVGSGGHPLQTNVGSYSPLYALGNLWKLFGLLQASISLSVKWG